MCFSGGHMQFNCSFELLTSVNFSKLCEVESIYYLYTHLKRGMIGEMLTPKWWYLSSVSVNISNLKCLVKLPKNVYRKKFPLLFCRSSCLRVISSPGSHESNQPWDIFYVEWGRVTGSHSRCWGPVCQAHVTWSISHAVAKRVYHVDVINFMLMHIVQNRQFFWIKGIAAITNIWYYNYSCYSKYMLIFVRLPQTVIVFHFRAVYAWENII